MSAQDFRKSTRSFRTVCQFYPADIVKIAFFETRFQNLKFKIETEVKNSQRFALLKTFAGVQEFLTKNCGQTCAMHFAASSRRTV